MQKNRKLQEETTYPVQSIARIYLLFDAKFLCSEVQKQMTWGHMLTI